MDWCFPVLFSPGPHDYRRRRDADRGPVLRGITEPCVLPRLGMPRHSVTWDLLETNVSLGSGP